MDYFDTPAFASRVEELIAKHHVPAFAIALVHNGKVASAGYGKACLDPPQQCNADTIFDIASASKSLTAAAVGLLVEDENHPDVQWDAPLSEVLPSGDFVVPGDGYTKGITLDDMIGHMSGLAGHDDSYLGIGSAHTDTPRSVTRNLRNLQPAVPIRSKFIYCNMMYTVGAYLVECKSGMTFADYVHQRIFQPLGMNSSNVQPSRAVAKGLIDRMAIRYRWREHSKAYISFPHKDEPEAVGAGCIVTSANDYIKYVEAIMEQKPPFVDSLYNALLKLRAIVEPDGDTRRPHRSPHIYCAGWETYYYRGFQVVEHDGLITGSGSRVFFMPQLKFGGVFFGNSDNAGLVAPIVAQELIDELLAVPASERPDWDEIESDIQGLDGGGSHPTEEELEKKRQEMCPGIQNPEPQERPLSAYTGDYSNAGYHVMKIEEKDGKLFINAPDRSMPYTVTLSHICNQTKYLGHLEEIPEGSDDLVKIEFVFDGDRATRFGIELDRAVDDLIWFDR